MKRKHFKISRLLYTVYLSSKSKFQLQTYLFIFFGSSTTRALKRLKCEKYIKKKKKKVTTCDIQDLLNYYSYYYMRIHNFYMYIIIYYVSRYLLSSPISSSLSSCFHLYTHFRHFSLSRFIFEYIKRIYQGNLASGNALLWWIS